MKKAPTIKPMVMAKRFDEKSPTAKQRAGLPVKAVPARSPMKRIL
jgi:hypothetical protein